MKSDENELYNILSLPLNAYCTTAYAVPTNYPVYLLFSVIVYSRHEVSLTHECIQFIRWWIHARINIVRYKYYYTIAYIYIHIFFPSRFIFLFSNNSRVDLDAKFINTRNCELREYNYIVQFTYNARSYVYLAKIFGRRVRASLIVADMRDGTAWRGFQVEIKRKTGSGSVPRFLKRKEKKGNFDHGLNKYHGGEERKERTSR